MFVSDPPEKWSSTKRRRQKWDVEVLEDSNFNPGSVELTIFGLTPTWGT